MPVTHPGTKPGCPLCRGDGYVVVPQGERAVARACSCVGPCPRCQGTGFSPIGDDRRGARTRCDCRAFAVRLRHFDAIGIPSRMARGTFEAFEKVGNAEAGPLRAFIKAMAYLRDFQPGKPARGLIFYGDVGRGKTHLLIAMLHELVLTRGLTARFVEFSHLLSDIKAGFDKGEGMGARMDPLVAVDVLAIDEIGKGKCSDFEIHVLDELVSRRYNAQKLILGTTNYAPSAATGRQTPDVLRLHDGDRSQAMPALTDRVGDRVFSRLREMCDFQPVLGEDYRMRLAIGGRRS